MELETDPEPEIWVSAPQPCWIVDRTVWGNIVLERRFINCQCLPKLPPFQENFAVCAASWSLAAKMQRSGVFQYFKVLNENNLNTSCVVEHRTVARSFQQGALRFCGWALRLEGGLGILKIDKDTDL